MPKLLSKLIAILDGTPAEYGKRQRGQSLVETALVTPLLIVLFASMVEIGWFANNYLTLLDVTRAGARRGTVLQDNLSPLKWDNRASHVPLSYLEEYGHGYERFYIPPRDADATTGDELYRESYRTPCVTQNINNAEFIGFYNEIACQIQVALDPLRLNREEVQTRSGPRRATDDIIISAFAVEIINGSNLGPSRPVGPGRPIAGSGNAPQAVVVGRYPTNANECEVQEDGSLKTNRDRDPFDFNENNKWDVSPGQVGVDIPVSQVDQVQNANFYEVIGFDNPNQSAATAERQVGFVWLGNHVISDNPGCLGSEWSIAEMEYLLNLPNYLTESEEERAVMPSQGVVLVEMFWEHRPLLNLPLWEPFFQVFSDRTTISVWAAFPLPSVEPYIVFND